MSRSTRSRRTFVPTGISIRTNFDFGFQGQRCVNVAVGHGDVEQTIEYGGGVNAGNLDTFKVGAGSVRWVNELGYDQVIDCGPGHPCDLAIRVQITDNTLFFSVPLCYGPTCPPEPADPVVLIPTPTTTTTTVHPHREPDDTDGSESRCGRRIVAIGRRGHR